MPIELSQGFRFGAFTAEPLKGSVARDDGPSRHLAPKAMDVLVRLAEAAPKPVTRDDLITAVWGERYVSDEVLTHAIKELRHALDDSPTQPRYIQTIPKRGYRLLRKARPIVEPTPVKDGRKRRYLAIAASLFVAVLALGWFVGDLGQDTESTVAPAEADAVTVSGITVNPSPRIAVLPFADLSPGGDQEYFSDGISEEILNLLAQIGSIKVIARQSSSIFKGQNVDIATIAAKLDVSYVLEGSVRRSGDRVRITAQLIDATDSSHLWSEAYDRDYSAENLIEIQCEIARAITGQLHMTLTGEDEARLARVPTQNTEAYDAYLRARQGIARRTTASLLEATEQLERAIELDPAFATAHAALAYAYRLYWWQTGGKIPEGVTEEEIDSLISRALELNPDDGFARALHAFTLSVKQDPVAEAEFERALELSPNDPDVYDLYARTVDNPERRLDLLRQGLEFDPKSVGLLTLAGLQLQKMGRPDEARAYYERAIEADPASLAPYSQLALLLWYHIGRLDEAMRWLRIGYSMDPGSVNNIDMIGWTYLHLNDDVTAERWFRRALELAPNLGFTQVGMLDVYHRRGQHAEEWKLWAERPGLNPFRRINHLIYDRRYLDALELARAEYPGDFEENDSPVAYSDLMTNDELYDRLMHDTWKAQILDGIGDQQGARDHLANIEEYLANRIVHWSFVEPLYAKVYALLGRNDDAIEWLRLSVADGTLAWALAWMADPAFDRIRDEPEFQQLLKEIEAELAIQLERVREMERRGEIPTLEDLKDSIAEVRG